MPLFRPDARALESRVEEAGPENYENGDGFDVNTGLGRADNSSVSSSDGTYYPVITAEADGVVTVQVYAVGDASEVAQDTDLSDVTFTVDASKT